MKNSSDVWFRQATQWERVGPPLRPGIEDQRCFERIVRDWSRHAEVSQALLLGVTPEVATMKWENGTNLLAIDCCQKMIEQVWPGFPIAGRGAVCGDWLHLPLAQHSCHVVISDGCFGVIRYPDLQQNLLHSIRQVLRHNGLFVFRVFTQAETRETPDVVYDLVLKGHIRNFHTFKLRLLMSLQQDSAAGVCTGDVWKSWVTDGPNPETLALQLQWPKEEIATINAYKDNDSVYYFPTLAELQQLLTDEGFQQIECSWPSYELGERCPILAWKSQL